MVFVGVDVNGSVGTNGSFSLYVTIDVPEGNHTIEVEVGDGSLSTEGTLHLIVEERNGSNQEGSDEFIPFLHIGPIIVFLGMISLILGKKRF